MKGAAILKIEKISNDRIKITLDIDELASRKISPAEIQNNKQKAQDFFFKLIEESKLQDEFLTEGSQLFIEASSVNNQFMIIITKVFDLPNNSKYYSDTKTIYRLTSSVYEFCILDNLLSFAKKASNLNLFLGFNSLYLYNNKYYLIFSSSCVKNPEFIQTFIVLSEYCDNYYKNVENIHLIYEYGKCIFEKKALNSLTLI